MGSKCKLYTVDGQRMVQIGQPGYQPGQEQAKIYHDKISDIGLDYQADITDNGLAEQIRRLAGIPSEEKSMKVSVTLFEAEKAHLTVYSQTCEGLITHKTVACYVKEESDYKIANAIISTINQSL